MVIFSVSALAGVALAFVSLFFLRDGLPEQLVGVKGMYEPVMPMREYYRPPGFLLWVFGLVSLNVGWLGTTIIRVRLNPDMLASFPVDYIVIAAGLVNMAVAAVFFRARTADNSASADAPQTAGWLQKQFRGPGYRLCCVGALITCAGILMLVLTRVI